MKTNLETTYTERAGKMAARSRKAACRAAGAHWRDATKAAADVGSLQMECINQMRAAGEKILEASGRTQLAFSLEVKEFIRRAVLPHLPPGMEMPQIQACVHIASRVPKPIETSEELKAAKAEMQLAFEALGLIDKPHRSGEQNLITRNLFCTITTLSRRFAIILEDLEKENPMEKWDADTLDEFLETCVPIVGRFEQAKKLRLGISTG